MPSIRIAWAFAVAIALLVTPSRPGAVRASSSAVPLHLSVGNVRVSHDAFLAHSEPAIAENPRNPRNLVAGSKFFSDPAHYQFKIGTYYSMDAGRTWKDSGLLPGFDDYGVTSDVSIAFSSSGVAYVVVLACAGGICRGGGHKSGIFISRSVNGGKTFSAPVPVFLDATGTIFNDKPWITVDQTRTRSAGTVYVAWNLDAVSNLSSCAEPDFERPADHLLADSVREGVAVARSTDGARTFSKYSIVAPYTKDRSYIGATPVVGHNGTVSVAFSGVGCSNGSVKTIYTVTSTDHGVTFKPVRAGISNILGVPSHLPNGTFRNITLPAFAASPRARTTVLVWSDTRNGDADIYASRSLDGGQSWSKPRRVNDDALHNGKDQFQPALAVSANGTYTCSWFDRRRDPKNHLIDEEIAQSTDGGLTFGSNKRVTEKAWDASMGAPQPEGRPENTFIGDYQGLAVDDFMVHPLWNDTQNGSSQEIETAAVPVRLLIRH